MNTPTYIFHDSGIDVCQQDTLVIYLKDEGIDRADGHEVFKLGKSRDSKSNGLTAVERARGRYQGKGFFDACITFNLLKVCELMGVPYTPELLDNPAQDPKFDDWLRARLPKPWKSANYLRGKVKTNDAGVEELLGHRRELREELVKAIAEICGFAKKSPKPLFQLYAYQRPVAQLLLAALLKWEKALMQCFGGYGKSATALDLAVRLYQGRGYVLILSPVKVTIQDFKTTALKFKFGDRQLEVNIRELKDIKSEAQFLKWIAQCEAAGIVPVVIDTVQSARGKDKAAAEDFEDVLDEKEREKMEKELRKLDKRYAFLKAAECFLLMRDETHLHFAADQTSQVLTKLKPRYTLDMTATITARENAAFKYENEAVVTFGLLEALLAKRDDTDPILARLPDLKLMACTHLDLPKECQTELGAEANINGQKVFDFKKGRLTYPTTALEVIDMTFSLGAYGTGLKPEWKACTLGREVTQTGTGMLIVPRGGKEGGAWEKIDFIVKLINTMRGDQALAISSYEFDHRLAIAGTTKTSKDILEDLRKEAGSRKLIIVTHHKLLTGVNLPALEGIALWDKIGSQALFMQTEYRLFRVYEDELFGLKKTTKMVVYEPEVAIHDSSALQAMSAELRDGVARTGRPVKEIEHLIGLSVYTDAGLREVTHTEMEAAYQAQLAARTEALYGTPSISTIRQLLGEARWREVMQMATVGQGSKGGKAVEPTTLTEDNGARTTKPGVKASDSKEGRQQEAQNALILQGMLEQLKLFSVHGCGGSLDSMEVAGCSPVRGTWGEVNQAMLKGALERGAKEWCDEHLRVKQLSFEEGGNLGPSDPAKGTEQQRIVLDNPKVVDLLLNRETRRKLERLKAGSLVLAVNPKSGLLIKRIREINPLVEVHALTMDEAFDHALVGLGLTHNQIHRFIERGTMLPMEFDLIIGNPPYLNGMHVKIIKRCLESLTDDGVCVMVHPSTPYIRPKKEGLRERLVSLQLLNPKTIWDNVELWVPLAIAVLKKNEQASFELDGQNVSHDTQLTPFGLHPVVLSLRDKLTAGETLDKKVEEKVASKPFVVQLPYVSGHAQRPDMHFLLAQKAGLAAQIKREAGTWFNVSFDTKQEALHFASFLTSKLAMAGFALTKLNQHVYLHDLVTIPWLDFTKHWTDEMLYEHFKLTPEEIAWVEALPAHPRRSDPV